MNKIYLASICILSYTVCRVWLYFFRKNRVRLNIVYQQISFFNVDEPIDNSESKYSFEKDIESLDQLYYKVEIKDSLKQNEFYIKLLGLYKRYLFTQYLHFFIFFLIIFLLGYIAESVLGSKFNLYD